MKPRQGGASFRGQPLVLLAVLLVGWACLRVSLWEAAPQPVRGRDAASPAELARGETGRRVNDAAQVAQAPTVAALPRDPAPVWLLETPQALPVDLLATELWPAPLPALVAEPLPAPLPAPLPVAPAVAQPQPMPPRVAAGHNLLLLAGLANMEIPQAILAYLQVPVPPAVAPAAVRQTPALARWSADGWLMLRQDSASPLLSGRPSYGRSQMGAALRYRLDPASARAPQVQLRASRALAGAHESEAAAGLSIRPVPEIPVRVAAEMRLAQTDRGRRTSPAAYAVTELPPVALPLGLRGEAYAQAGYVGGEFATPFVDGQARVDRAVAGLRGVQLRAGAGAWGGAQNGSARLDVGPSAALTFRVGDTQGRVAADYRLRVAGRAEPSSGPAITLSAGF